jgi:adenine specific DNA methylase Mod
MTMFKKFKESVNIFSNLIVLAKKNYHDSLCKSLKGNATGSKNYWTLIKNCLAKNFVPGFLP